MQDVTIGRGHGAGPPRRSPEPAGHADGDRGHGRGLRGHRSGRLLECGMLGRGDLRLLHPLPQRRPVGAAPHVPQADAQLPPADALAGPEPAGLSTLRGHGRRSVRGQVGRERHGRLPRLRRAQRRPEPQARHGRRPPHRQARRGDDLLHHLAAAHGREVRRDGPAAQGHGLRLDLHQGHGGLAEAPAGLRHRQGHQGEVRQGHAGSRARAFHHGRHDGQPDEGHRGGRRHRRHRRSPRSAWAPATTRPRPWSRCSRRRATPPG